MKWPAGLLLVLAMSQPCGAQAPAYYPLKAGMKWTYDIKKDDATAGQTSTQVAEIETIDGQSLARVEASSNGNVVMTEHLAAAPDGVYRHRINGVKLKPAVCILKSPFKEGETWEQKTSIGTEELTIAYTTGPAEDVTTPAGMYKAVTVRAVASLKGMTMDTKCWYAPDVGMVKQTVDLGGKLSLTLELARVEGGK